MEQYDSRSLGRLKGEKSKYVYAPKRPLQSQQRPINHNQQLPSHFYEPPPPLPRPTLQPHHHYALEYYYMQDQERQMKYEAREYIKEAFDWLNEARDLIKES